MEIGLLLVVHLVAQVGLKWNQLARFLLDLEALRAA